MTRMIGLTGTGMRIARVARERCHTLCLLEELKAGLEEFAGTSGE
jgi:hypothetical protein